MLLLDDQSSAAVITSASKKVPIAGIYYLVIEAGDFDDGVVNVFLTVSGMTFKIKETDGTEVSAVDANATYLVQVPRGATVQAITTDPSTGIDNLSVGLFYAS